MEITWQAPEFEYRKKGVSWYWISIVVAVAILALTVWQKNFLFGFFVILAEILLLIWAGREPLLINFTVSERGLFVGDRKFYVLADIESFGTDARADADTEWPNLFFEFRRRLRPIIKIKIPKNRVAEIEKGLATMLRQTKHEHSLLDALEELIGF